jgi:iron(III) transport system permease protein
VKMNRFAGGLFKVVSMLPVVSPPFVLSLSMIMLFGKAGIITRYLLKIYDNSVYGFWGIVVVQSLTFFPVCYMMFKGLLKNIDPSLEEAARDMGASRFKVFTSVTFPLLLPGIGNAFLVTFIESIADFANPMIIGGNYDTLATTIYLQITGAYDKAGAAAMAVVLLCITLAMFIVQKYVLEARSTATLTGKASRGRMLIEDKSVRIPLTTLCSLGALFVVMMYICVPIGALFPTWGFKFFPLTGKWFKLVFTRYNGFKAFKDSFMLSLIAAPITALLSMIISYLVVKRKFRSKAFIEAVSMLAMAVPGTVLGVGYIRGFSGGLFHTGLLQGLYGTGAILIIVFIIRSLPTGTRSGIAALRQIDKSIEESAYDMGADSFRVFTTVTLPLIKDSFLSGLVTAFVRSITAISAIILLVTPQYLLITVQINEFAEKGSFGLACAFASILILITYGAVLLMNLFIKYFGTSRKFKEAE